MNNNDKNNTKISFFKINPEKELEVLNELLSNETTAVKAYTHAINETSNLKLVTELDEIKKSHLNRVKEIREFILKKGGYPVVKTRVWKKFLWFSDTFSTLLNKDSKKSLFKGEKYGTQKYKEAIRLLRGKTKLFVKAKLFPKQIGTEMQMKSFLGNNPYLIN